MAMTRWPSASKRSLKCDPRNPAPPVTTETGFGRAGIWECVLIATDAVGQRFPALRGSTLHLSSTRQKIGSISHLFTQFGHSPDLSPPGPSVTEHCESNGRPKMTIATDRIA